ncbi:MAG: serine protein kinase PrkA [Myxococcota bacterium]
MSQDRPPSLDALRDLETSVRDQFAVNRRVLSFDEYFTLFQDKPAGHSRTAAQYLRDCLDFYGTRELDHMGAVTTRYRLFDCPWEDDDESCVRYRVVGQESAQAELYRMLTNFIQEGRVTRLILLHGPNGSAKSSFIRCLARGLEAYSTEDVGAIYAFNWVFPSSRLAKKRLGFGGEGDRPQSLDSYAHLEEEDIDARLPADLRDHPLLLLPKERRRALFEQMRESGDFPETFRVGDYLTDGDLSPRSRMIADTLLNAYHGDFQRLLQHIQVERFYFSLRYRRGVVTIEPQLHVDASVRQVTMDQQLQSLPPSLRSLNLYEPMGDLVDANRGMVEFNDLLKKPLDSYKYLLATCEKGTVALPSAILHLDTLFLASSNERHLAAFKEYQDFPSFKGRMDLVKMPYLRNYRIERAIYEEQIARGGLSHQVAPHATYVVALWAVLTRLRQPIHDDAPEGLRAVLKKMSPIEKAEFYAGDREPEGLTPEQTRELRAYLPILMNERQADIDYEGAFGASPREMKEVMLNALQDESHPGLTPLGIFDELRKIVKLKSVYEWLKRPEQAGYHGHDAFIDIVFERWLDHIDNELRTAMGLVSAEQYDELFQKYILHVSYLLKGEKIYNSAASRAEAPDSDLMERLETIWKAPEDRERFRRDLIGRVGAYRIDYPGEELNYRRLFPALFRALEADYYSKQKAEMRKAGEQALSVLTEEAEGPRASNRKLTAEQRKAATEVIERLEADFGYPRPAIREALGTLIGQRY